MPEVGGWLFKRQPADAPEGVLTRPPSRPLPVPPPPPLPPPLLVASEAGGPCEGGPAGPADVAAVLGVAHLMSEEVQAACERLAALAAVSPGAPVQVAVSHWQGGLGGAGAALPALKQHTPGQAASRGGGGGGSEGACF